MGHEAGLLHDIGKLVLLDNFPEKYESAIQLVKSENMFLYEAEKQVFKASHAEVGAYLLGLWGLPSSITEALAFHHRPRQCPSHSFSPLVAVHVADALKYETEARSKSESFKSRLDRDYLDELDLSGRIDAWQAIIAGAKRRKSGMNERILFAG